MALFSPQEVVWAKLKGYPWWPAFVETVRPARDIQNTEYTVRFFGDFS